MALTLYKIPVDSSQDFSKMKFRTTLEDTDYILRFRWNTRMESWIMDIYDAEENSLNTGIAMRVDSNVTQKHIQTGLPRGLIVFSDTEGNHTEATFDSLGDTVLCLHAIDE